MRHRLNPIDGHSSVVRDVWCLARPAAEELVDVLYDLCGAEQRPGWVVLLELGKASARYVLVGEAEADSSTTLDNEFSNHPSCGVTRNSAYVDVCSRDIWDEGDRLGFVHEETCPVSSEPYVPQHLVRDLRGFGWSLSVLIGGRKNGQVMGGGRDLEVLPVKVLEGDCHLFTSFYSDRGSAFGDLFPGKGVPQSLRVFVAFASDQ